MIGTRARLAVVTLVVLGSGVVAATTSDAAIGPECFGDTNVAAVCATVDPSGLPTVNPTGGPGVHDCVFVGPPPCMSVDVPTPSVTPGGGGSVVGVQCSGLVLCAGQAPDANSGDVWLDGGGTISPGLTVSGGPQTILYGATGTGEVGGQEGRFQCGITWNDSIGTLALGSGSVSGVCTVPCGSMDMSGSFVREAAVVTLRGNASGCLPVSTLTGTCAFIPTSAPTVTSFDMDCDLVLT